MDLYVEPHNERVLPIETGWEHDPPMAVAIGMFDGLHVGHRAVIRQLRAIAASRNMPSGIVTFSTHPAATVRPASAPKLLTSLDAKIRFLRATGIDRSVILQFDTPHSLESAPEFVQRVLVDGLNAGFVVVGADFHFGHGRGGNVDLLERMGADHGFGVLGMNLIGADGTATQDAVSSTLVRAALAQGNVERANELLGRPHEISGQVERGDQRGRTFGFPTANVAVDVSIQVPEAGIYAGWASVGADNFKPAAIYIGNRPTVYGTTGGQVVEVHLLDWDGDLYGSDMCVRFCARIRGDRQFESFDHLVDAIRHDCDTARTILMVNP